MNKSIIRYIIALVMLIEAGFMLFPALVGLCYRESTAVWFLITALAEAAISLPIVLHKPKNVVFTVKAGYIATAISWIVISLIGALPFTLSRQIPSYIDALFEMVSGFTTTGSSILTDVEALDHCMNFWRCLSHWIGGMGVLVFLLMVLQMAGGSHINLMKAESPGPSVGKITAKMRSTARTLYILYGAMTLIMILLLLLGGMPLFDAVCTAFGTAGTGGFGIKADSMASYSPYIQWVTAIFMMLFGVNFNVYVFMLFGKWKQIFKMEEVRAYFIIILAAVGIIMIDFWGFFDGFGESLRQAFFQVSSIITTTGFATDNFDLWPETSKIVLVLLMFIGACAGSTGGGLKVSRLIIGIKTVFKQLHSYLHPKGVKRVQMDGAAVDHEVIRGVNVYFIAFGLIYVISLLFVSTDGKDLVTTFTAVAATINNIGPGLAGVGPAASFAAFSDFSKIILSLDMLIGRLEIFPILLLCYPPTWKGVFKKQPEQTRFKF